MSEKQAVSVELKDLVKVFPAYGTQGDFTAVNHVSLTAEPGEMVTLLGPSGCGKTTILRMVSGFEIPTSGQVLIGGKNVSTLPPNKRNVGMMFQSYALFPHLNVFENVAYGLRIKHRPEKEIRERVKQVLELMQIESFEQRMPNQLSGGQQQRVALARAVVTEPSVLLFDEPLSNLDAKLREYMRDELRKIQQRVGITSIYVTHDQSEAMAISDKVVVMRSGEIVPFEGECSFDVKAHGSRLLSICEDKPHTVLDCNFKVLDTKASETSLVLETQYPAHAEMLLNGKVAAVTFNGKALPWKQEGARLLFELPGKGELEITWDSSVPH